MKLLNFQDYQKISEGLDYHIKEQIPLCESIFQVGSESYLDLVNEMRRLYFSGNIEVCEEDEFILEKLQTGKKGTFLNKETKKKQKVSLDDPAVARGKGYKYYVYRAHPKGDKDEETGLVKAVMITYGTPGMETANWDEGRRKSFLARHRCAEKTDLYAPGWWSCNVHKFWKKLGLKSSNPW
tara:strand:- start:3338 stop:3883 length:546 start_codon:yes stop_codon:yes gene_type:complete